MKLSAAGLELLKAREQCRLEAYQDGGGVWTIGYGHALGTDAARWKGFKWSQGQADSSLVADVGASEFVVARALEGRPATQEQFDACVSLAFNIGGEAFRTSTLVKLWHAGASLREVAKQFARWCKDNGQYVEGLAMRRGSEIYQFAGAS